MGGVAIGLGPPCLDDVSKKIGVKLFIVNVCLTCEKKWAAEMIVHA